MMPTDSPKPPRAVEPGAPGEVEAEYTLETSARCPACTKRLETIQGVLGLDLAGGTRLDGMRRFWAVGWHHGRLPLHLPGPLIAGPMPGQNPITTGFFPIAPMVG